MKTRTTLSALLFASASVASAIDIVESGATGNQVNLSGTYTQNFDTLLSTTPPFGGNAWNNNVTIPGWYSTQSSYSVNATSSGLSSYGTDSDRALGSVATNWELRFVNTTSETITGFTVSYDVEQWYRGANSPQVTNNLLLYYRVYDASISEAMEVGNINRAGWTNIPSATFISPNASLTTGSLLDGNLAENQAHINAMISGISLAPGEKLWLQWLTGDDLGNDHALATDNVAVSFTTIPEPAAFTALAGLVGLSVVTLRRRRS